MSSHRLHVDIFLNPGEITAHARPVNVKTIVGSCVAICLWDPHMHIGGVNHFLLPAPTPRDQYDARYGSVAIPMLINELLRLGADRDNLQACVVGGGHHTRIIPNGTIGQDNTTCAIQLLESMHIAIARQDTGGPLGRKLLFNTGSGELHVRTIAAAATLAEDRSS